MITKTLTGTAHICMHLWVFTACYMNQNCPFLLVAFAIWTKIAIKGNSTALEMDKTGNLIPSTLSCTIIDYHVANSWSARTKSHRQKSMCKQYSPRADLEEQSDLGLLVLFLQQIFIESSGPQCHKTCLGGSWQSLTQSGLLSYRNKLENWNFAWSKFRYDTFQ